MSVHIPHILARLASERSLLLPRWPRPYARYSRRTYMPEQLLHACTRCRLCGAQFTIHLYLCLCYNAIAWHGVPPGTCGMQACMQYTLSSAHGAGHERMRYQVTRTDFCACIAFESLTSSNEGFILPLLKLF